MIAVYLLKSLITRISLNSTYDLVMSPRTNRQASMPDLLFFDGKCPVCAHEINLLRRFSGNELELVDIHSAALEQLGIDKSAQELLTVLHLRSGEKHWLIGLDATVKAWSHTRIGWLLEPLRWPIIKPIADAFYLKWATRRVCKLGY